MQTNKIIQVKYQRKFEIPMQLVMLEDENYHLLIKSQFSNGQTKHWIIDTGASKTVFDSSETHLFEALSTEGMEINSAGIGAHQIETSMGVINEISFHSFHKKRLEVALINLEPVNHVYQHFSKIRISGLLGSDFLRQHKAIINYQRKQITLYR
jgi:hypothetical protein